MRLVERLLRTLLVLGVFALSSYFALRFGPGGLWKGLAAAHAVAAPEAASAPYDLTRIVAVNETLDTIHKKYVDPSRIDPRRMFLSALDHVQKEVAQVIVLHDEASPSVRLRVDTDEREFRVDTIQAHWDVASRLREVFEFLQARLKNTDVDLRHVEYAACNGILATLDPHSVFLSPEDFEEMNLSTTGHFGGLGIVISVRDQLLTVMRPMPGTPAGRAGLRRFDRITKINNESTLNMPLDDAVERLRGKPGSKVTVWVHRDGGDGWSGARPFELVREKIEIHSVHEHLLAPGVGYVRLEQFQSSTDTELEAALQKLSAKQPLSGLVIDLRGNPGGLLDRAIKVADLFLDQGVIVSTVGASEGTSESTAQRHGTQPGYPIVVLVSASSASASEIVAGALKNHERALVMGQTTFGKGSVQLVFPQMAGGAALKLTVAQYLTPGGISIQGVGVTPDIALDPMTADPLQMDLYRTEDPLRERDLSASLSNGAARGTVRPAMTLRYNLPIRERLEILERGGDMDDEFSVDFPVRIARDVVAKLQPGRRSTQLRSVKELLDRVQNEEIAAVSADLKRLGVDWSPAPLATGQHASAARAEDFVVKIETDRAKDTAQAGQPMTLAVTVENTGKAPLYRLRATTDSDSGYYTAKELVFGRLDPGQKRRATAPFGWCDVKGHKPGSSQPVPLDAQRECLLPFNAVTRQDVVKVHFEADGGEPPKDVSLRPTVESLPAPSSLTPFRSPTTDPATGTATWPRARAPRCT